MGSPVRFGVIGTNFVSEWFVAACGRTDGRAVATAVLSRSADTGAAFAAQHGVASSFTDFDAIVDEVEAVYIASPNALHHPQALRAIAAGRHVLVEKVMATSVAEVDDLLAAAADRGVVAMEATRPLHAPTQQLIREALPQLGRVRQVSFAKCQYSSRYDDIRAGGSARAFDPTLGNSALADIGVYVLQPAIDLFGAPATATGTSAILSNGFEGAGSMMLGYGDLVVDVSWSKITQGVMPSVILGEDAAMIIDDLAEPALIELRRRVAGRSYGPGEVLYSLAGTEPWANMHYEILDFVDQVEAGVADPRWAAVSRESRRLMDQHLARLSDS